MLYKSWIFIVVPLTLLISACSGEQSNQMEPMTQDRHLFLLIGQSNMAGRGVVAPQDTLKHNQVLTLTREGDWVPASDPIHFDKPIAGVGPGRSFGLAVVEENPGIEVGLIPAAVGGSPISSWQPGGFYDETGTHPYDDAIERTKLALESGQLKGILWHQGESDSNMRLAPIYSEKLRELIQRLRSEFDDPDLPFLIGQLGQFDEAPWGEWTVMVDEVHQQIALDMENVEFISSDSLTDKGDALHFSAEAARELGRRFAEVYLNSYSD